MKKSVLQYLLILSTSLSMAQTTFQKAYGGFAFEQGNFIQQTADSGFIVAGTTSSFGEGGSDIYLIKTTASGDSVWTKTYGGIDNEYGFCVQQTADGGYIVSGVTPSFADVAGDFYLIKTNALGDTLWSRTYGGSGLEWGLYVQQTFDGGYILTGQTPAFGAGAWDLYLIKTDTTGNISWTKTYGGSSSEFGYAVQQTADSGYIISGEMSSYGAGSGDVYLIKTDVSGNTIWTKTYGGTDEEIGLSVKQTTDGGYIVAGYTYSFGLGNKEAYLIKTNASGTLVWSKTYGGVEWDDCNAVVQSSDGGYALVGTSRSFSAGGDYDMYLIKTDTLGNILWTKTYGGTDNEYGFSIANTFDGGYILSGSTTSFSAGFDDVYLVKTDANGNSGCHQGTTTTILNSPFTGTFIPPATVSSGGTSALPATAVHSGATKTNICSTSVDLSEINPVTTVLIYPNPFFDQAQLSIQSTMKAESITLCNIFGQIVKIIPVNNRAIIQLHADELPAGVYLYKISGEDTAVLAFGKIVIQ